MWKDLHCQNIFNVICAFRFFFSILWPTAAEHQASLISFSSCSYHWGCVSLSQAAVWFCNEVKLNSSKSRMFFSHCCCKHVFVQLYSFPIHLLRFKCIKSVSEPTKGLPCKSMLPGFNNDVIVLKKRHVNKDFVAHADMPFVPGSGSTHKCQFVRNQRSDKFPATQPDFG